jgi:mono/diheme cytochrome c family protein
MKMNFRTPMGFLMIFASLVLFVSAFSFAWGDDLAPGKKIFEGKCAQCHGKDAKGVAKMLKVLKVDAKTIDLTGDAAVKLSDADATKIITDGKKKMPKYKGKLTGEVIQSVVAYLRTLQTAAAPKKGGNKK